MFFDAPETYLRNSSKQNQALSSYAQKRYPEDSELNLNVSPRELYNLFRACDPDDYPAYVMKDGVKIIVKKVTQEGKITYEGND
jgi:methionyl-tRNA formyltransferase/UDP-4-amino-4-deoxy-L-arabinose formyltransferase/UDP-glucuronic acid dehydrogenase (UDP-4-keto-hexauronic acid decarboxylating)